MDANATTQPAPSAAAPGLGAAIARAAALARPAAAAADARARLDAAVVAAVTEAGFARHFVPRRWGGTEGTFTELLDAAAQLGESCPSTAWCATLWAWHGRFAAVLPERGQRELWARGPDTRIAATVVPPAGQAGKVPGGWRVTGRWRFASGVDHADWLLVSTPDPRGAQHGPLVLALPRQQARIAAPWNGVGLRGTGSHDIALDGAEVPEHRAFSLPLLLRGDMRPGRARCHAVPPELAAGQLMCAPALGAARRALAVWTGQATARAAEGPAALAMPIWEALARATAELDAAALLLRQGTRRADRETVVTPELTARARCEAALAAEMITTAVERLFRTGGTHAGDASGELQRAWRDVHTATAHAALRLGPAAQDYGLAVAGRAKAAGEPAMG
ncbi:oxidoreductase [Streptomyces orinoci]|uniref:Oxidoreductase n=1 Tax=Streptomyces orinoci TaxID=67339 RepID=A0ABV3JZ23_STRON|nr:oxidoreductase [Streptomyces orinoci]